MSQKIKKKKRFVTLYITTSNSCNGFDAIKKQYYPDVHRSGSLVHLIIRTFKCGELICDSNYGQVGIRASHSSNASSSCSEENF